MDKNSRMVRRLLKLKRYVWVTARRKRIPVRKMTVDHINNCIACWEDRGLTRVPVGYLGGKKKWLRIFNEELCRRGITCISPQRL